MLDMIVMKLAQSEWALRVAFVWNDSDDDHEVLIVAVTICAQRGLRGVTGTTSKQKNIKTNEPQLQTIDGITNGPITDG